LRSFFYFLNLSENYNRLNYIKTKKIIFFIVNNFLSGLINKTGGKFLTACFQLFCNHDKIREFIIFRIMIMS